MKNLTANHYFARLAPLAIASRPLQIITARIPWLDQWNILSEKTYHALMKERNLRIVGEDNEYIYAKDSCLQYIGPSSKSQLATNASQLAIHRLSRVTSKYNLSHRDSDWANALLHNIILRSYREFMPSSNISLRTCDLASGDVFVDIGCFRGYLSLKASKTVGPKGLVYSFDPINSSVNILKKQVEINNIENIRVFASACVSEDYDHQSISFLDAGDGSTNNSVMPDHLSVQTRSLEVRCISAAAILSQIANTHLSSKRIVASITTNGSEFQLLKEMLRHSPVSITCCIPTLYTYAAIQKQLPLFRSQFPAALINHSHPWLQVRLDK